MALHTPHTSLRKFVSIEFASRAKRTKTHALVASQTEMGVSKCSNQLRVFTQANTKTDCTDDDVRGTNSLLFGVRLNYLSDSNGQYLMSYEWIHQSICLCGSHTWMHPHYWGNAQLMTYSMRCMMLSIDKSEVVADPSSALFRVSPQFLVGSKLKSSESLGWQRTSNTALLPAHEYQW